MGGDRPTDRFRNPAHEGVGIPRIDAHDFRGEPVLLLDADQQVSVNTRNGVLGNKLFRQGLMYAIDQDFGKDAVWNGFGRVRAGRPN
jgi:hypothetical protein